MARCGAGVSEAACESGLPRRRRERPPRVGSRITLSPAPPERRDKASCRAELVSGLVSDEPRDEARDERCKAGCSADGVCDGMTEGDSIDKRWAPRSAKVQIGVRRRALIGVRKRRVSDRS